jgi:hypothetical protein
MKIELIRFGKVEELRSVEQRTTDLFRQKKDVGAGSISGRSFLIPLSSSFLANSYLANSFSVFRENAESVAPITFCDCHRSVDTAPYLVGFRSDALACVTK